MAEEFIPPHPPRLEKRPSLLRSIALFRRSMLDVWMKGHFASDFFATKILRRRIFVCNSPDTVREAFVEKAETFHRKSPQQRYALEPLLGDGLFVSEGETWRQRRRAVAPVTHASRMRELAPVMTEVAGEWADRWRALPDGAEIDALEEMARMTAEVICRTLFGRALGSASAETVVHAFSAYQARVGQTALGAMLNLPEAISSLQGFGTRREARRIHAVLDELIAAVLAAPDVGEASLVRALSALQAMEPWALRNEAATLFMAGHETTANTMAWSWYLLSQSSADAQRLADEAKAVLGGRSATLEDVDSLPFARAVIEESLRLYPPVPVLAREALEDGELAGRPVPKGSLVLVVPWLLHRNPKLWDAPDTFRPARFLDASPPRYGYVPFAIGPRVCTGQQFGMVETVICLATLAQHAAPRLKPGHKVAPVSRLTLRPGDALPMVMRKA
ncbi:cytochrome P450 [Rhodovarius crocodyli]|uniref:Cytochrome P450 n=2 Tax=Rhodovarius crocodyli TaxID=1979269 RepID=A0A437MDT7_9PROT|nr:cytochrome P450 [Rhodovarius crocodyli]